MVDPRLVELVDSLGSVAFEGNTYRNISPRYAPMSGEGSRSLGGRWNPPDSFPVLYMALARDVANAEVERHARMQGILLSSLAPRRIYEYRVELSACLDLRSSESWAAIGWRGVDDGGEDSDRSHCQAIGDAAHYLGLEGILAPSATKLGEILALFTDKQVPGSIVEVAHSVEWP